MTASVDSDNSMGVPEGASRQVVSIDPLSVSSLYLKLYVNGNFLSNATGFVAIHKGRNFLVTNWHVLSGRDPEDAQKKPLSATGGVPDQVRIAHHVKSALGTWVFVPEPLFHPDRSPRWTEHPAGPEVDVVALELSKVPAELSLFPLSLALANANMAVYPGMPVFVIGFPLGLRPNQFFPIWKTGHIAADPDLPYGQRPAFLIDATTRQGMSGSPVIARSTGSYINNARQQILGSGVTKLLGVYAHRIHKDVEIGCVWRPSVIQEVLERATAGR